MLQTSARLTLLASEPAAVCWLADLATSYKWQRWTPSMALLRERTCWLAACAARSAIAFGPTIIPNYLAALGRSNQIKNWMEASCEEVDLSRCVQTYLFDRHALIRGVW
jgi:hypothetical protein